MVDFETKMNKKLREIEEDERVKGKDRKQGYQDTSDDITDN